jgi:hypothetical protein
MAESENDLLGKTYHLKSSDLDRIQKLISANDSDALQLLNNVDREIGFACGYFSLLETCSFEVTFLDNLISKGKEYSDSDVEFKVRDSLLKVAAELDASNLGNLIPLFKSFDLNNDESYLIKTEQVRNAVEKVFLEILIIKKRTYNQAKSDYLSEHIHCKFYPIKPDGRNGVTIENFWPEKPTNRLKQSELEKPKKEPGIDFNHILLNLAGLTLLVCMVGLGISLYIDGTEHDLFSLIFSLFLGAMSFPIWFFWCWDRATCANLSDLSYTFSAISVVCIIVSGYIIYNDE